MIPRSSPLKRSTTPIRRVSKKRAPQLRAYARQRKQFLIDHPICEIWCAEKGWEWYAPGRYRHDGTVAKWDAEAAFLHTEGAPLSTEVHHRKGRIGEMLLQETWWFAVCRANHERIHANPREARERGWLLR